ncbi:MAG: PspC domain-containing protein [Prolixibacteraceae bacterium]
MKKTFTINISGSVFHIEEDAYEKLRDYLQMLTGHFGSDSDGREILQDIEARIAELFSKKMEAEGKDVILEVWVEEVMARMGKPEDFIEQEEEAEEPVSSTPPPSAGGKVKRRMYRDPDHRVLGGVCSGLGAYFNIDPVVLRIIFFILFWIYGIFLLFYIVLWIAVPKAKTTAEKLEMRGQEPTVSNIEKSIKEEVKEVKESYKRFRSSNTYEKGREQVGRFGDVTYNVLKVILRIVVIVAGAFLILLAFLGLIGFITSMVVGQSVFHSAPWISGLGPEFNMPEIVNFFIAPGSMTILLVAIALLIGIPLLGILYAGTKMVFRFKSNSKLIFLSSLAVWMVALVTAVVVVVSQIKDYNKETTITQNQVINCQNCKTLYLELGDNPYADRSSRYQFDLRRMRLVTDGDKPLLIGEPRLDVEESSSNEFLILIRKKSRGSNQDAAKNNVEDIIYNFTQNDSIIRFNPYYTIRDNQRWLDQEVDITVKVPRGKSIYLANKMETIIYDIENVSNTWDGDMVGKYWEMTDLGLQEKKPAGEKEPERK